MNQHENVIFNGNKIPTSEFECTDAFRAIMYGDGLLESILIDQKHIFLLDLHLDRLIRGMNFLKLAFNPNLALDNILANSKELLKDLPNSGKAYRLRIVVWRSGFGKYAPDSDYTTNSLLSIDSSDSYNFGPIKKIEFSENVTIFPNSLSNFKTLNGLPYVLAAMEKNDRGLDEMLLLNSKREVVEGTSSNVFFVKNGILMTPKLNSGCLDGVMRNYLITSFKAANIKVMLKDISQEEAKNAETTFFSNSFNLRYKIRGNSASGWLNKAKSFIDSMPKQPLLL
jgi:branched-subunit amino acid aminotransferase/4-amino-4-deoxychorismate lyase